MSNKVWFRVLISVFLLVALLGAGLQIYKMGMLQGATVSIDGELPATIAERYLPSAETIPAYAHGRMMFFSPLRFIGGFFFLLFILAGFRMVIFGCRGPRRFHRYANMYGCNGENVPPMVAEWHRKMHEQESPKSED